MSSSKDSRNNRGKLNIKERLKLNIIAIVKKVVNDKCLRHH